MSDKAPSPQSVVVPGWPEGMTYGALDDVRYGRGLPPLTPRHEAPACTSCGGKGYTEHEGGDGEGYPSRTEIEDCPRCHEAPAEGAGEFEDLKAANKDHCRAVNTLTLEAIEFERQIADLRASVVKANSGFEEYERKFYLAADDVDRLKLAICGGEDAPGAISAVSVDDCERFITEERGRHIDTEARLEYVRASRDGAAGRAHDLYTALAEVKEQVVTYPLSDNSTCMCGAPLGGHNVGSGHAPVSLADHAISLIVEGIDKALRFGAPTDGRPDDYEGPDAGMHDTEIVERDND